MIRWLLFVLLLMFYVNPYSANGEVMGSIFLKDGSIIYGDIVEMVEGSLKVKAAFGTGEAFLIKWEEVDNLATSQPVVLLLVGGSSLIGVAEKGEPGVLLLSTDPMTIHIPIQLASITAINPPEKKPVKYKANINFGGKISSGNTDDAQANLLGGFEVRSERLRLILDARYFYAEESKQVTDRNAFGTMDLNFFMTSRWFLVLGVLMEQDTFDDLNLRTAVTAGPGYQFIDKGDFVNPYFTQMTLQGDIGVGFLDEDRKIGEDDNYGVYRWQIRWEWEIIPNLSIFHRQIGFPEVGHPSNWYINTLQGIRFNIWKGLNVAVQVNYKYDNKPADDSGKSDTTTLFSLGYNYEN